MPDSGTLVLRHCQHPLAIAMAAWPVGSGRGGTALFKGDCSEGASSGRPCCCGARIRPGVEAGDPHGHFLWADSQPVGISFGLCSSQGNGGCLVAGWATPSGRWPEGWVMFTFLPPPRQLQWPTQLLALWPHLSPQEEPLGLLACHTPPSPCPSEGQRALARLCPAPPCPSLCRLSCI